jgi:hypothetical protein
MAGTPKRRAELAKLREGLEEFCELLLAGKTDKQACAEFGVNVGVLYKLMQEDSDAAAALARARKAGALAMASETIDIADELAANLLVDPAKAAQARISSRQWLAGRRNREELGDSPKVAVQLNIADMHLTALKAPAQAQAQVLDVQVLPAPQEQPEPQSLEDLL